MLSRVDEKLWKTGWYLYYPLYILSLVGFNIIAPKYLSLLLLWKFNPLKKAKPVTVYDRQIIFSAGTYLLLTTVIGDILMKYNITSSKFGLAVKGLKFID